METTKTLVGEKIKDNADKLFEFFVIFIVWNSCEIRRKIYISAIWSLQTKLTELRGFLSIIISFAPLSFFTHVFRQSRLVSFSIASTITHIRTSKHPHSCVVVVCASVCVSEFFAFLYRTSRLRSGFFLDCSLLPSQFTLKWRNNIAFGVCVMKSFPDDFFWNSVFIVS